MATKEEILDWCEGNGFEEDGMHSYVFDESHNRLFWTRDDVDIRSLDDEGDRLTPAVTIGVGDGRIVVVRTTPLGTSEFSGDLAMAQIKHGELRVATRYRLSVT